MRNILIVFLFGFLISCSKEQTDEKSFVLMPLDEAEIIKGYKYPVDNSVLLLRRPKFLTNNDIDHALSNHSLLSIEYIEKANGFVLSFSNEPDPSEIKNALRSICFNCRLEPVFVVSGTGRRLLGELVAVLITQLFFEFSDNERIFFLKQINASVIARINGNVLKVLPNPGISPFEVVIRAEKLPYVRWAEPDYVFKIIQN